MPSPGPWACSACTAGSTIWKTGTTLFTWQYIQKSSIAFKDKGLDLLLCNWEQALTCTCWFCLRNPVSAEVMNNHHCHCPCPLCSQAPYPLNCFSPTIAHNGLAFLQNLYTGVQQKVWNIQHSHTLKDPEVSRDLLNTVVCNTRADEHATWRIRPHLWSYSPHSVMVLFSQVSWWWPVLPHKTSLQALLCPVPCSARWPGDR